MTSSFLAERGKRKGDTCERWKDADEPETRPRDGNEPMSLKIPLVTSLYCTRISTLASLRARADAKRKEDDATIGTRSLGASSQAQAVRLTLSGLHDERHTLPSGVVDEENGLGEGGAVRSLGDGVVLEVSGLAVSGGVLSEKGVLLIDGGNATENLDLNEKKMGRKEDVSASQGKRRIGTRRTFSSRMSSAEKETGRSMVRTERA